MEHVKNNKTILAFVVGILLGIMIDKILLNKKKLVDQQTVVSVPVKEQKLEEVVAPEPVVPLANGTFKAPEFKTGMPKIFETKAPGEFTVKWTPVPGASRFRIKIVDKSNQVKMTLSTTKDVLYVQKIPWDGSDEPFIKYKAFMVSVNADGTEGPPGEVRELKLYKEHAFLGTTNKKVDKLQAPEIKSITTED